MMIVIPDERMAISGEARSHFDLNLRQTEECALISTSFAAIRRMAPMAIALAIAVLLWITCATKVCGLDQESDDTQSGAQSGLRLADEQALRDLGMEVQRLESIDALVEQAIEDGQTPGAVVMIGYRGNIAFQRAYGNRSIEPEIEPMTIDTVFDLASLTKPIATATSVMMLVEQGQVRLRDPAANYLPGFEQNGKQGITVTQLLTHQGGLIPDNPLSDYRDGRDEAVRRMLALETTSEPGTRFAYTDVGFIALGEMVHAVTGRRLDQFVHDEIFEPLGMHDTGYRPDDLLRQRAATTEKRDDAWIKGEVHDPRAFAMDGVAGHAGLFSTAPDLAIYAQMMLNGGEYEGQRILAPQTIRTMTNAYPVSSGLRGLGWDKLSGYSSNRGELMSNSAYGHGGFTGTAIWIDPEFELFVIFLSTRLHPDGRGTVNSLAGRIGTIAVGAIDEPPSPAALEQETSIEEPFQTLTGLDVLARDEFALLHGQRVGLITNHTGVSRDGQPNVELFAGSERVDLRALFSPEHGFEGTLDVSRIDDSSDSRTGLKIFSLYGETRKPTPEMLADVDVLVFDIQDIGARFYTYISTMGQSMTAAAEQGKSFIVLDRPNPIRADIVEGPVLDQGKESFVGFHPIAVRHGMTAGEIALMLEAELELDLKLTVVPCDNWSRAMSFDETGLTWINPSPNMRCLTQAFLYPGIGLLETTNLSVGRGTDTPFEIFGAPWLDGQALARHLNQLRLPGVTFLPIRFAPESSVYAEVECEGVNVVITDRDAFLSLRTGFEIAVALRALFPEDWESDRYHRLLADDAVLSAIQDGASAEEIESLYREELQEFEVRRRRFLIYR